MRLSRKSRAARAWELWRRAENARSRAATALIWTVARCNILQHWIARSDDLALTVRLKPPLHGLLNLVRWRSGTFRRYAAFGRLVLFTFSARPVPTGVFWMGEPTSRRWCYAP